MYLNLAINLHLHKRMVMFNSIKYISTNKISQIVFLNYQKLDRLMRFSSEEFFRSQMNFPDLLFLVQITLRSRLVQHFCNFGKKPCVSQHRCTEIFVPHLSFDSFSCFNAAAWEILPTIAPLHNILLILSEGLPSVQRSNFNNYRSTLIIIHK